MRERYEGSGAIIDVAGTDCLHAFPKCKSTKELEEHLDAWEEMLEKYGGQLVEYAPSHVKIMLIKTLPSETEAELFEHPELDTWEKILDWCRKRLLYKNQKFLASYLRPGSSRINAVRRQDDSDDDEDDPVPVKPRRGNPAPTMPDLSAMETMVAAVMRKQMKKGARSTSPGNDKKRFVWSD